MVAGDKPPFPVTPPTTLPLHSRYLPATLPLPSRYLLLPSRYLAATLPLPCYYPPATIQLRSVYHVRYSRSYVSF